VPVSDGSRGKDGSLSVCSVLHFDEHQGIESSLGPFSIDGFSTRARFGTDHQRIGRGVVRRRPKGVLKDVKAPACFSDGTQGVLDSSHAVFEWLNSVIFS
jgi:hypothetical protein